MTDIETLINQFSGITNPDTDINLDDGELEDLITEYVEMVKAWIDDYTRINYSSYTVYPPGLTELVMEITSNILRNHVMRKDTPIMDNENYKVHQIIENVVNDDLKYRLKPYIRKPRPSVRIFGNTNVTIDSDDEVVE